MPRMFEEIKSDIHKNFSKEDLTSIAKWIECTLSHRPDMIKVPFRNHLDTVKTPFRDQLDKENSGYVKYILTTVPLYADDDVILKQQLKLFLIGLGVKWRLHSANVQGHFSIRLTELDIHNLDKLLEGKLELPFKMKSF